MEFALVGAGAGRGGVPHYYKRSVQSPREPQYVLRKHVLQHIYLPVRVRVRVRVNKPIGYKWLGYLKHAKPKVIEFTTLNIAGGRCDDAS